MSRHKPAHRFLIFPLFPTLRRRLSHAEERLRHQRFLHAGERLRHQRLSDHQSTPAYHQLSKIRPPGITFQLSPWRAVRGVSGLTCLHGDVWWFHAGRSSLSLLPASVQLTAASEVQILHAERTSIPGLRVEQSEAQLAQKAAFVLLTCASSDCSSWSQLHGLPLRHLASTMSFSFKDSRSESGTSS